MSEDIKSKIKKIVADHLGIDEEKVTEGREQALLMIWVQTALIQLSWLWLSKKNLVLKFLIAKQKRY